MWGGFWGWKRYGVLSKGSSFSGSRLSMGTKALSVSDNPKGN